MSNNTLKWHSCSTEDFPPRKIKPCKRCNDSKIACEYTERIVRKSVNRRRLPIDVSAFDNQLYRLSSKSNSSLLTLLFDFFNLSSQPIHIWDNFVNISNQQRTGNLLFKEAYCLFISYNTLYSSFIDNAISKHFDSSAFLEQQSSPTTDYSIILLYSLLSITFYSAYEALPHFDSFHTWAHLFYKRAHLAFIEACFSTQPPSLPQDTVHLLQSSILLAHFQCQAIHENQAYMTIRIGIDLAHRFEFTDSTQKQRRLAISLKVLEAWHVWLSLYLNRPYSDKELGLLCETPTTKLSAEQAWAIHVMDAFIDVFKKIMLKKLTSLTQVMDDLKFISDDVLKIDVQKGTVKSPLQTIQLYYNTLTLQLLHFQFHQLMDHCAELDSTCSLSSQSTTDEFKSLPKNNLAVIETCVQASENILTTVNHHPITTSSPVLYSVCQLAQLCTHPKAHQLAFYSQLQSFLKDTAHLDMYQPVYHRLNQPSSPIPTMLAQQQDMNPIMHDLFMRQQLYDYQPSLFIDQKQSYIPDDIMFYNLDIMRNTKRDDYM